MKMDEVLRKVAEKNKVSVKEVQNEIQKSIDDAWNNPFKDGGVLAAQRKVPCKGEVPTPEELIRYIIGEIVKI